MRLALIVCALVACERPKDDHRPGSAAASAPGSAAPRTRALDVNGNAVTPKTVLAATRGGEVVHLAISSAPDRTCRELFDAKGITMKPDEILVQLEVAHPLFASGDNWIVSRASWPGGMAGPADSPFSKAKRASTVDASADLAKNGGTLRIVYDGEFQVGTGSPRAWIAIDSTFTVTPCHDVAGTLPPPQPVAVTSGTRTMPIRGARVSPDEAGWKLELSTLPRACNDSSSVGDFAATIHVRPDAPSVHVYGDLVPTQQTKIPRGSSGLTVTPAAPIDGTGSVRVDVDVDMSLGSPEQPFAMHGHVDALRCAK